MKIRRIHVLVVLLGLAVCLIPFRTRLRASVMGVIQTVKGRKTVVDRLAQYGDAVYKRLAPRFKAIGVEYPPRQMVLIGLKQEQLLEVWVSDGKAAFRHLKTYPILGASGTLGPKLMQGDRQVPEGLYQIEALNPNSSYHLALRVNYPNRFDQAKGKLDGRTRLGSDIMIHGSTVSIGCLAMGDPAAEELFVLAARTGVENISVILSPVDFRVRELPPNAPKLPSWTPELYAAIRKELSRFQKTPNPAPKAAVPR